MNTDLPHTRQRATHNATIQNDRTNVLDISRTTQLNQRGEGLTLINGRSHGVRGGLPDELLSLKAYGTRRRAKRAKLNSIIHSPWTRLQAFCEHYHSCGGCQLQELTYHQQCKLKKLMVLHALKAEGIKFTDTLTINEAQARYYYRNKMEFSFSARAWKEKPQDEQKGGLGLFVPRFFDKVVNIRHCFLQDTELVRSELVDWAEKLALSKFDPRTRTGLLRNFVVRTSLLDQNMYILVASEWNEVIAASFSALAQSWKGCQRAYSAYYAVLPSQKTSLNDAELRHLWGDRNLQERNNELTLSISPTSFYQTNSLGAERLYASIADKVAALVGDSILETIVDLFCGIGGIGLHLSRFCKRVVGVDINEEAIKIARINADTNNISNAQFVALPTESLDKDWYKNYELSHTLIVVDPPRAGLHPKTLKAFLAYKPKYLVYVSCNPHTLSKDLAQLTSVYDIKSMELFDLFPHTRHVETIASLAIR